MNPDDNERRWGISHLRHHPMCLSVGLITILALVVLVCLRLVYGAVDIEVGAGIPGAGR